MPSSTFLFVLRMLPAAASTLFAVGFVLPGFFHLEPRDTTETVSPLMMGGVLAPFLLLALGGLRGARSWLATRRLVERWTAGGRSGPISGISTPVYRIDSDFPVIALAGVLRPRLFVSRRVWDSCTPSEFSAILAHEAAHLTGRDNLKRLLMRASPDFLCLTRMGRSIEQTWSEVSDMSADDVAAGPDRAARTELAAALVKVSRLAVGRSFPLALLASAFHRGGNIERRVRLLVSESARVTPPRRRGAGGAWVAAGVILVSLASSPAVLMRVHQVTETVVRLLQ
jgi:hypothetical protein